MKVLVVDDHPAMRLGVRTLLSMVEDIEVVGETKDAQGALNLAVELEPDLVMLDLKLKGEVDGIEVCRRVKALSQPPRVLVYSACNAADDLAMAALAGADSYLHKGIEHVGLADVVRHTHAGKRVWNVDIRLEEAKSCGAVEVLENVGLTPKEREVYALMLQRYSNAEIAKTRYTSISTTKNQVRSILRKLGLKSRRDLF